MISIYDAEAVDVDLVRRVAAIIGPNSAAADALRELDRRLQEGEDAAIYRCVGLWIVGPRLATEEEKG